MITTKKSNLVAGCGFRVSDPGFGVLRRVLGFGFSVYCLVFIVYC